MLFEFRDVQQAAESLPGLQLDYRQLEQGSLKVTLELQTIGEVASSLVEVDRLIDGRGHVVPGSTLFLLCLAGGENRYDDRCLSPGQVYIKGGTTPPGHQLLKPGYRALLLNLPDRLMEAHLGCPMSADLLQGSILNVPTPVRDQLLTLVREASLAGAAHDRHLGDLLATGLCQGLGLLSAPDFPSLPCTKAQLACAIRERLQDCPEMTFGDICRDLCISERTLRRVFTEVYSMSPGQYQLAVRLNQVRESLRDRAVARGTVSEIATRKGFWHMGRFSAQYRRHFGETPSQTLTAQPKKFYGLT